MKRNGKGLLVITELFLPTKGGTAVWFDEVYRRLGGREIHIVTAEVAGAAAHDREHPNSVHRLRLKRHWWLKPESLGMYTKFLANSLGILMTRPVNAIHAGRVLPEGLVGWIGARLFHIPLIVYAHGEEITTWRQPAKFKAMSFVYSHADLVIANSEFTREELLKLGVEAERITLIYPGVDIERFRPGLPYEDLKQGIGLVSGQKLLLSVGRLSRRKGFDLVIKTLPDLVKSGLDVHYALIGIGEDRMYLRELAEQRSVADRVHFLGHVSTEDLPRWYNACDLFVMPNREIDGDTEGFGMVFIEAAACGKASIAGKAGGTGAAVIEGVTGLRVDGECQSELYEAITELLGKPDLLENFAKAALQRARGEFGWESVARKTMLL